MVKRLFVIIHKFIKFWDLPKNIEKLWYKTKIQITKPHKSLGSRTHFIDGWVLRWVGCAWQWRTLALHNVKNRDHCSNAIIGLKKSSNVILYCSLIKSVCGKWVWLNWREITVFEHHVGPWKVDDIVDSWNSFVWSNYATVPTRGCFFLKNCSE